MTALNGPVISPEKLSWNLQLLNEQGLITGGYGPFGVTLLPSGVVWLESHDLVPDDVARARTRPRAAILGALAAASSRGTFYSHVHSICEEAGVTDDEFGREISVLEALGFATMPCMAFFQITSKGLAAASPSPPLSEVRTAPATPDSAAARTNGVPQGANRMIDQNVVDFIFGLLYLDMDRHPGTCARDLLPKALEKGFSEARFLENFRFVARDDRVDGRAVGGIIRLNLLGVRYVEKHKLALTSEIERRIGYRKALLTVLADARDSGQARVLDDEICVRCGMTRADLMREGRLLESGGLIGGATIGEWEITNAGFTYVRRAPPRWDDRTNLTEAIRQLRALAKGPPMSQAAVSKLTRIPLQRLNTWMNEGRIKFIAEGGSRKILVPTLIRYLEKKLERTSPDGESDATGVEDG